MLAVWVVLHHLMGKGMLLDAWGATLWSPAAAVLRQGYLAVGTFFVLSGFVLALGYRDPAGWTRSRLLGYSVSRFARVYPVYALSLLIMAPFMAAAPVPAPEKAAYIVNYGLLLQGWTGKLAVNWNTPAWSLSCEMFFYLCFPLAAAAFTGANWRSVLLASAAVCALPAALRAAGLPAVLKPLMHLADFLIGIAAARGYALLRARRSFTAAPARAGGQWLYVPAGALSIALIAFPRLLGDVVPLNTALRPLNALLVIGLALGGGVTAAGLSSRGAVFLGKASYSMYILHIPLLWWYRSFGPPLFGAPPALAAAVFVLAVILISAAVFRFIEEPLNRGLRNRLSPPRAAEAS